MNRSTRAPEQKILNKMDRIRDGLKDAVRTNVEGVEAIYHEELFTRLNHHDTEFDIAIGVSGLLYGMDNAGVSIEAVRGLWNI
jgi:hypothetical protein